jgi:hypothetical protein
MAAVVQGNVCALRNMQWAANPAAACCPAAQPAQQTSQQLQAPQGAHQLLLPTPATTNCRDLSNNAFCGSLPPVWSNLTSLEFVDLSHNKLTGPLPAVLSAWDAMQVWPSTQQLHRCRMLTVLHTLATCRMHRICRMLTPLCNCAAAYMLGSNNLSRQQRPAGREASSSKHQQAASTSVSCKHVDVMSGLVCAAFSCRPWSSTTTC